MLRGSCLCGGVSYQADGPLKLFARCHCSQCRKASGAEFASNGSVAAKSFQLVRGAELVREFESSPGKLRAFCSRCGSPLFARESSAPDQVRLRTGSLDSELAQQPRFHIFVSSKPGWSEICDDLPQFHELPE